MGIAILNNIPWEIFFLFLKRFGKNLYYLKKKEECKKIQKKIGYWFSHNTDNDKGYGYSIGYWYFLSMSITTTDQNEEYSVILISNEATYRSFIDDKMSTVLCQNTPNIKNIDTKDKIIFYERTGTYWNVWFRKRTIDFYKNPFPIQQNIMDEIIKHQKINKTTVAFLHGLPGSGKSMIGLLLAKELKGSYCNSLIPWQPGDTLNSLYTEADPSEDKPMILVLEEIDIALVKIHAGIERNDSIAIPIPVSNKTEWNNMFDLVHSGLYPNLIILLTSNKTPDFINELDSCYIRKGRVDYIYEIQ